MTSEVENDAKSPNANLEQRFSKLEERLGRIEDLLLELLDSQPLSELEKERFQEAAGLIKKGEWHRFTQIEDL